MPRSERDQCVGATLRIGARILGAHVETHRPEPAGQDPATRGGQQTVDLGHPIVTGDDARVAIRGGAPPAFACTLRIQAGDQASSPILQPGDTRPVGTVE